MVLEFWKCLSPLYTNDDSSVFRLSVRFFRPSFRFFVRPFLKWIHRLTFLVIHGSRMCFAVLHLEEIKMMPEEIIQKADSLLSSELIRWPKNNGERLSEGHTLSHRYLRVTPTLFQSRDLPPKTSFPQMLILNWKIRNFIIRDPVYRESKVRNPSTNRYSCREKERTFIFVFPSRSPPSGAKTRTLTIFGRKAIFL